MIQHLHVLGVGVLYVLGFFLIPFLLGLPLEMYGARHSKMPIDCNRSWFIGLFFIAILAGCYIVGIFFV